MAKQKEYILKVKDGKEIREFSLNQEEYKEFLMKFEENELIEFSKDDIKNMKITFTN